MEILRSSLDLAYYKIVALNFFFGFSSLWNRERDFKYIQRHHHSLLYEGCRVELLLTFCELHFGWCQLEPCTIYIWHIPKHMYYFSIFKKSLNCSLKSSRFIWHTLYYIWIISFVFTKKLAATMFTTLEFGKTNIKLETDPQLNISISASTSHHSGCNSNKFRRTQCAGK